uniref:Uncharacterized protein n=1 Tax=Macrostomum lignano TaxID=282301 RepID=A0A1I8FAH9_9PLAT
MRFCLSINPNLRRSQVWLWSERAQAIRAASAMASSSNSSSDTPQPPPATATRPLRLLCPHPPVWPDENGSAAASAAGGRQRQGRGPQFEAVAEGFKENTMEPRPWNTSAAAFRRAVDATPLPPARRPTLISRPRCRCTRTTFRSCQRRQRRPWRRPRPALTSAACPSARRRSRAPTRTTPRRPNCSAPSICSSISSSNSSSR